MIGQRACTKCGKTKPLGDFHSDARRRDGKKAWCKDCSRKHTVESYKARYVRNMGLIGKAKDKLCMDCGGRFPPEAMDFDHVRGKKLFTIGGGAAGRSLKALHAEMAKCDVVCANCHRVRTKQRGS